MYKTYEQMSETERKAVVDSVLTCAANDKLPVGVWEALEPVKLPEPQTIVVKVPKRGDTYWNHTARAWTRASVDHDAWQTAPVLINPPTKLGSDLTSADLGKRVRFKGVSGGTYEGPVVVSQMTGSSWQDSRASNYSVKGSVNCWWIPKDAEVTFL